MEEREIYSNQWGTELAQLFKSNQTYEKIGAVIGDIVSVEPLIVSILDGEVIINSTVHDVYISENMQEKYEREVEQKGQIQISGGNYNSYTSKNKITTKTGIEVQDKVLVVTDEEDKVFFIISKLKKV